VFSSEPKFYRRWIKKWIKAPIPESGAIGALLSPKSVATLGSDVAIAVLLPF